jgi:uncharacterized protein YndB with AHSA1/START domain
MSIGKWIGGCLLVVILLIVGSLWWGYQTMQSSLSPDGSAAVTIGGTPARVFASLANGDSIQAWMASGSSVITSRHGPLQVGDTVRVEMQPGRGLRVQRLLWVVSEVAPDRALGLELRTDTSTRVMALRRDSLVAMGDSTKLVSTVVSPMMDSLANVRNSDGKKSGGRIADLTADLLLSAFRMQSKLELLRLKAMVEGKPVPDRLPGAGDSR